MHIEYYDNYRNEGYGEYVTSTDMSVYYHDMLIGDLKIHHDCADCGTPYSVASLNDSSYYDKESFKEALKLTHCHANLGSE